MGIWLPCTKNVGAISAGLTNAGSRANDPGPVVSLKERDRRCDEHLCRRRHVAAPAVDGVRRVVVRILDADEGVEGGALRRGRERCRVALVEGKEVIVRRRRRTELGEKPAVGDSLVPFCDAVGNGLEEHGGVAVVARQRGDDGRAEPRHPHRPRRTPTSSTSARGR